MFVNAKNLKYFFKHLQARPTNFVQSIINLLVKHCQGDEWKPLHQAFATSRAEGEEKEEFKDIPLEEAEKFIAQSKFEFDPYFTPGIIAMQKDPKGA